MALSSSQLAQLQVAHIKWPVVPKPFQQALPKGVFVRQGSEYGIVCANGIPGHVIVTFLNGENRYAATSTLTIIADHLQPPQEPLDGAERLQLAPGLLGEPTNDIPF